MNDSVRKEYEGGKEVIIVPADIVFEGDMTIDLGGCTVKILQTKAPHTDDSTLVYVCEDKTLFLGDATCAQFPNGGRDKDLANEAVTNTLSRSILTTVTTLIVIVLLAICQFLRYAEDILPI